ncbi:MAG TPA: hypothetical protein VM198_10690 [Longimicrobiales bacterium]|nr:hypothetical protein [Longimicrobiales bacterium]
MPLGRGAMLAHGLRVVWPLLFGLYALGWKGLRQLAVGEGLAGPGLGIVFAFMGTWLLRSGCAWWRWSSSRGS